jgi:transcriptional regulator with XRE-family HTH domain
VGLRHDDPALDALGVEIRRLRTELGLTQDELGERVEIHRNYIGMLERGERNPSVLTLLRLAGGLGVSAATLMEAAQSAIGGAHDGKRLQDS